MKKVVALILALCIFVLSFGNNVIYGHEKVNYYLGGHSIMIAPYNEDASVGTLSFFTDDYFASVGHRAYKKNYNSNFGNLKTCKIIGINRSMPNIVGQKIALDSNDIIGKCIINNDYGIYGVIDSRKLDKKSPISLGKPKIGEAIIVTELDEKRIQTYSITIFDIIKDDKKQIKLKIDNYYLINKCGGIIQGMSGTPIVQDGKLVGCVSHVVVEDPTIGYGLDISMMVEQMKKLSA